MAIISNLAYPVCSKILPKSHTKEEHIRNWENHKSLYSKYLDSYTHRSTEPKVRGSSPLRRGKNAGIDIDNRVYFVYDSIGLYRISYHLIHESAHKTSISDSDKVY